MDDNSAQVTAAESSDPDVATLKREYYMLKHDNDIKEDRYPFPWVKYIYFLDGSR